MLMVWQAQAPCHGKRQHRQGGAGSDRPAEHAAGQKQTGITCRAAEKDELE